MLLHWNSFLECVGGGMCMCSYRYVQLCVWFYVSVCAKAYVGERSLLGLLFNNLFALFSANLEFTDLANWLASKPQGFFCVHLPTSKLFYMGSGNQTWVLLLTQWTLYWASPSAKIVSLSFFFFSNKLVSYRLTRLGMKSCLWSFYVVVHRNPLLCLKPWVNHLSMHDSLTWNGYLENIG